MPSPPAVKTSVYQEEFAWIAASREARLSAKLTRSPEDSLIGIAFSGGGIRSATFNLGVIQGLAKSKLLHKFDYISSVSGGGYISSWLLGWMHHQSLGSCEVQRQLKNEQTALTTVSELPEIRFLRNFSNYLTPRKGLFSADFWTFLAIYLRNTTLNLLILFSALLALAWLIHQRRES
jgi:predicted acylesterase/phospholipase RssA